MLPAPVPAGPRGLGARGRGGPRGGRERAARRVTLLRAAKCSQNCSWDMARPRRVPWTAAGGSLMTAAARAAQPGRICMLV